MDTLSKETVGLPVFIASAGMHSQTIITSDNVSSSSGSSATAATGRRTSVLSTKRLSQALGFALASLDTLRKQAQSLLQDDDDSAPRWRPRNDDLESGGPGAGAAAARVFGEDGDACYRDWLD